MSDRPGKGKRYPKGRLNQLAGGMLLGNNTPAESVDVPEGGSDYLDAPAPSSAAPADRTPLTSVSSVAMPDVPKQPYGWRPLLLDLASKGGYSLSRAQGQDRIAGQLANTRYQAQLRELINQGAYQQALDLAKTKADLDAQQEATRFANDKTMQGLKTEDSIKTNRWAEAAKRGLASPELMDQFSSPVETQKLQNEAVNQGALSQVMSSPAGLKAIQDAWLAEQGKQGAINQKTLADTADIKAQTQMRPFMNVGKDSLLVNPLTGRGVMNQGAQEIKPEVPASVKGVNAFGNEQVSIVPNNSNTATVGTTANQKPMTRVPSQATLGPNPYEAYKRNYNGAMPQPSLSPDQQDEIGRVLQQLMLRSKMQQGY